MIRQLLAQTALALALVAPGSNAMAQVLRYAFDEPTGDALDSGAAPASNGLLNGGAARSNDTPSGAGSSIDFRTESPYAHVLSTDSDDLDGLSALTLTTWLKVETYPSTGSGNKRLIAKQAATNFGGFNFSMNATPNDGDVGADNFKIGLFVGNNVSSGPDDFAFAFADVDVDAANKWVMLAVTYDSALDSENMKFYIGDTTSAMTQLGSNQTIPQLTVDAGSALFGVGYTDAAPTVDTSVTGWQDDVRVYNTALDLAALDAVRLENLSSTPTFAADFTGDNKVNADDLVAWQGGFGTAGTATKALGDANADMDVDGEDVLIWQTQNGSGTSIAAVPEPTCACLAAAAVVLAGRRRHRRCAS